MDSPAAGTDPITGDQPIEPADANAAVPTVVGIDSATMADFLKALSDCKGQLYE